MNNSRLAGVFSLGHLLRTACIISLLLIGSGANAAAAPAAPGEPAPQAGGPSSQQIDAMIKTLEDPKARQQLIEQLDLLKKAQAGTAPSQEAPPQAVENATTQLIQSLSQHIKQVADAVLNVLGNIDQLPKLVDWIELQATNQDARDFWTRLFTHLAVILGLGYVALYVVRLLLLRPRRSLNSKQPQRLTSRAGYLIVHFLLDLIPIGTFAGVAYVTLGIVNPMETTRLVALAWINAAILTRVILALGGVLFSPAAPYLRLAPLSDETANYAEIWMHRLTITPVYGYFALQAALLVGLPGSLYAGLLRLLGLIVALLALILVIQNRAGVATAIRGRHDQGAEGRAGLSAVRRRLAKVWHLVAITYIVLLYGIWVLNVNGGFLYLVRGTVLTAFVLVIGRIAFGLLERLFKRGFRVSDDLKARFPDLEERANRYVPVLHRGCRWLVSLAMVLSVLRAWGMNSFAWLTSEPGRVLGGTLASVLLILLISVAVWETASSLIESYLRNTGGRVRSARTQTLLSVARNALLVIIVVVSTLMILSQLGVNIGPLLAGAGVLGVAIGFGSQKLVQDIITGVFILLGDMMSVGDVVKLGDRAGLVEAISIRNVRLRDLSGTVHTIPFSSISSVSNLTKDFSYYVFDIGVAYREDVDQVMDVLKEIGDQLQQDPNVGPLILAPLEVLGVDSFGDSAVVVKARIKTVPIQQWTVGRAFNRRIKQRFDELGIEIPFPHRTIYFGQDKQDQAPPARVQLNSGIAVHSPPVGQLDNGEPPPSGTPTPEGSGA